MGKLGTLDFQAVRFLLKSKKYGLLEWWYQFVQLKKRTASRIIFLNERSFEKQCLQARK